MSSSKNLALYLLASISLGCGPRAESARIAVAAPLTGDLGAEGLGLLRGAQLAAAEARAAGRLGYALEIRPVDDRASPDQAQRAARLIAADPRTVAVIGHYSSGCSLRAAPVYARAGLAMVVPSATHPGVTARQRDPDWPGPRVVFRLVPNDDRQGDFMGEHLYRRARIRRLAVLHDGSDYGAGLAARVRARFAALGGRAVLELAVAAGARDFAAELARLKGSGAEALYFGGFYPEAGLLLRQLRAAGSKLPFYSGDAARAQGLFLLAGEAADGARLSMVGDPAERLPGWKSFASAYAERFPGERPRAYDHFAYEAAWAVIEALERSRPERGAVLAQLRKTDRRGLLGRLRFDALGEARQDSVTLLRADWATRSFTPLCSVAKGVHHERFLSQQSKNGTETTPSSIGSSPIQGEEPCGEVRPAQ